MKLVNSTCLSGLSTDGYIFEASTDKCQGLNVDDVANFNDASRSCRV
jgi:hypothetical protein